MTIYYFFVTPERVTFFDFIDYFRSTARAGVNHWISLCSKFHQTRFILKLKQSLKYKFNLFLYLENWLHFLLLKFEELFQKKAALLINIIQLLESVEYSICSVSEDSFTYFCKCTSIWWKYIWRMSRSNNYENSQNNLNNKNISNDNNSNKCFKFFFIIETSY